jgi:DNA-binding response OmpR family regulator
MRVLIVEDEKGLAKEIEGFLRKEGFNCDLAHTGQQASRLLVENPYDLVLLDIGLPDMNGLDLVDELRYINEEASLIIVTARGEIEDKVKGFNLGADDYLAKPFSLVELHLRMQAVIRRRFGTNPNGITFGDFLLDPNAKVLLHKGVSVDLTKKEYDILYYLLLNRKRILDRMQLTEHIWGDFFEDDLDSNYIDVHIKNIRKKLAKYDSGTDWIKTVRGVGYRFNDEWAI